MIDMVSEISKTFHCGYKYYFILLQFRKHFVRILSDKNISYPILANHIGLIRNILFI